MNLTVVVDSEIFTCFLFTDLTAWISEDVWDACMFIISYTWNVLLSNSQNLVLPNFIDFINNWSCNDQWYTGNIILVKISSSHQLDRSSLQYCQFSKRCVPWYRNYRYMNEQTHFNHFWTNFWLVSALCAPILGQFSQNLIEMYPCTCPVYYKLALVKI